MRKRPVPPVLLVCAGLFGAAVAGCHAPGSTGTAPAEQASTRTSAPTATAPPAGSALGGQAPTGEDGGGAGRAPTGETRGGADRAPTGEDGGG
ncbi:MAG TPA: hypothetical protein VFS00_25285, partial [Polyangiaceae bacterium]|nr:hypothetical protein [Polyangiaceae bacterium]